MDSQPPDSPAYTLDQLGEQSGVPSRTIRSWIKGGLLEGPGKRGPGSHYGPEHLSRLQFLVQVRDQLGFQVPLSVLRGVLASVSRETIERVAAGEEPVQAVSLFPREPRAREVDPSALTISAVNCRAMESIEPPARRPARKRRTRDGPWTTIEVSDGVELRMRGDDPDRVAWLARLARRLREWIADG